MSVDSAAKSTPRLVRRGDKQPAQLFTELHKRCFEKTIAAAQEIHAAIEARATIHPTHDKVGQVDFIIAVSQCQKQAEGAGLMNRQLSKKFARLIAGDEKVAEQTGTINRLILVLAPLFLKAHLYPLGRFYCPGGEAGYRDTKKRLQVPKQPKRAPEVLATIETTGRSYWDECGNRISSELWRQASQQVIEAKQQKEVALIAAAERAATEQAMLDEPYYFEADAFERQNYGLELEETA